MQRLKAPAGLLLLALLLLACNTLMGGGDDPAGRYGVTRAEALYLVSGQPQTLDPARTYGGPTGPLGHLFSGLVTLDPSLQVQPDLAAGWQVSPDGLTYTFYLRRNALFHDGRPVTAQDVVFSWERAAGPGTGSPTAATYLNDIAGFAEFNTGRADHISGLRLIDDYTLAVQLVAPRVYFLAKLTYPVAFVVDRANVARPGWERAPNGTGPFRLQVWEDDDILILARNERFYGTVPAVSHVVFLLGPGLPLTLYENGDIDLVGVGGSTLARVQDPNDPLAADLVTGSDLCTGYIGFNSRIPPFDNPLVRQAFSYAVDRERLVTTLAQGNALVANGPLPPGMPGYTTRPARYPYDPEMARALLAQAGYGPGEFPTITYSTAGYGAVGPEATALITFWQENLGITIEPVLIDPYLFNDELFAGNVGNLFESGWCADYADPQNFLDVLFHSESAQNLGGFSDPAIDAALAQARAEPDVTARIALYSQIEQQLLDAAPAVFLSHSLSAVLVKPYVQGFVLSPIGVPQWHLVRLAR